MQFLLITGFTFLRSTKLVRVIRVVRALRLLRGSVKSNAKTVKGDCTVSLWCRINVLPGLQIIVQTVLQSLSGETALCRAGQDLA